MAKRILVLTPLTLTDIDLSDFVAETEYAARELQLTLSILTGYDGKGQRRLFCSREGYLYVYETHALGVSTKISDLIDDVDQIEGYIDALEGSAGDIDADLNYVWGQNDFDASRYASSEDDAAKLLAQGLFWQDTIGGGPTYMRTVMSLMELVHDFLLGANGVWDTANNAVTTKNYT